MSFDGIFTVGTGSKNICGLEQQYWELFSCYCEVHDAPEPYTQLNHVLWWLLQLYPQTNYRVRSFLSGYWSGLKAQEFHCYPPSKINNR